MKPGSKPIVRASPGRLTKPPSVPRRPTYPSPSAQPDRKGRSNWWITGAIIATVAVVRIATHQEAAPAPPSITLPSPTDTPVLSSPTPAAIPPVSKGDIDLASSHADKAIGADGLGGAMIYSLNCYASGRRSFTMATLDRCAAFDLLVSRVQADPMGQPTETAWFDAGTARRRYLDAVIALGSTATDAAARLDTVSRMAGETTLEPINPPSLPVADDAAQREPMDGSPLPIDGNDAVQPSEPGNVSTD